VTAALSAPVDGFRLAYDRTGDGAPVVVLHGWPGDRTDFAAVTALLAGDAGPGVGVLAPDLRGFGESDKRPHDGSAAEPAAYGAAAQARSVVGLLDELGIERAVVAGYDVGSRTAQALARECPQRVAALVVTPPLPGAGRRVLDPEAQREFWYQAFHQLALAEELVDGRPDAVRAYLRHFWTHWSGPRFTPGADRLDHLTERYAAPGAFTASINWYRAGSGTIALTLTEQPPGERLAVPTTVLWPEHDPLFPRAWSDRLDEWFSAAELRPVDGVGHFCPVEAPEAMAAAITAAVAATLGR
jgi:pimeloyl-ACP methyl ester carboxylesterase